jgi:hypothetical protein
MYTKSLTLTCLFAASLFFSPATGHAASISGTSIHVTSTFNSDPSQQANFADITGTQIQGGLFTDWMYAADPNTNIEFVAGVDNGDHKTYNELDVNFSGSEIYNNYSPADLLTLTFQLDPGLTFNTNFMAITIANDVQVPASSVSGGTMTLNINALDQISGNGGQLQLFFDVETPEPSTFLLGLPVLGVLLFWGRRRTNAIAI